MPLRSPPLEALPIPHPATMPPASVLRRLRRWGRRRLPWLQPLVSVALVAWIAVQLARIGWGNVVAHLPTTPLFYLLYLCMWSAPTVAERIIYGRLWGPGLPRLTQALLLRRLCSEYVVDYSGEAYLFVWARRHTRLPRIEVVRALRDNLLVSAFVSTVLAALLLGALAGGGWLAPPLEPVRAYLPWLLLPAVVVGAVLLGIARRSRRPQPPLPRLAGIGGIHALRIAAVQTLQVCLWVSVAPGVPLSTWLTLLAAQVALARIPFLPGRDLLFLGLGLQLAGPMQVGAALVAGLLSTTAALDRALGLGLYLLLGRAAPAVTAAPPDAARLSPEAA